MFMLFITYFYNYWSLTILYPLALFMSNHQNVWHYLCQVIRVSDMLFCSLTWGCSEMKNCWRKQYLSWQTGVTPNIDISKDHARIMYGKLCISIVSRFLLLERRSVLVTIWVDVELLKLLSPPSAKIPHLNHKCPVTSHTRQAECPFCVEIYM